MILRDEIFSGFAVKDVEKAKEFYAGVLGLDVTDTMGDALSVPIGVGKSVFAYPKEDHVPATFTVLNFPVDDIDATVSDLKTKGVTFEKYEGMTDDKDIARGIEAGMGPDIAWFKDPSGNIMSIIKNP